MGVVAEFSYAPEVQAIGEVLIDEVEAHMDLARVRIEYLFIDPAPKSHGRTVWGRAKKVSGLAAFFAAPRRQGLRTPAPFFVVEISHEVWETLNDRQRRALVDHELSHLRVTTTDDGELELSTRGHDVEEFAGIVARHGLWSPMARSFALGLSDHVITVGLDQLEGLANGESGDS